VTSQSVLFSLMAATSVRLVKINPIEQAILKPTRKSIVDETLVSVLNDLG